MTHQRLLGALAASALLTACGAEQALTPRPPLPEEIAAAAGSGSGTITFVLDVRPDDPVNVSFVAAGKKLKNFTLDDDPASSLPNSRTFTRLRPGTYTARELQVAAGTLAGISCTSTDARDNVIDLLAHTVTIGLQAGEHVTCTFSVGWAPGDMITYAMDSWGIGTSTAGALLLSNFDNLYINGLEVGIPGAAGFSMRFFDALAVFNYLPAVGTGVPLFRDHIDPTSTESGFFGGNVVSLQLDVDFSDAGHLVGASGVPYGDLILCKFDPSLQLLNGLSVRQYLGLVNTVLGGGSGVYTLDDLLGITFAMTRAFDSGTVVQFARDHLFIGACA